MRIVIRLPGEFTQPEADDKVGARLYVPDGEGRREIGYVVSIDKHPLSIIAEIELHDEEDLMIAQMRRFEFGRGLIP